MSRTACIYEIHNRLGVLPGKKHFKACKFNNSTANQGWSSDKMRKICAFGITYCRKFKSMARVASCKYIHTN
jgi:hypothetical protein